ncbi:VacJ family lipoprotein [uncultured Erythrobacter sp.]|uniref:MlaA family lipoprotein n=1 Tax=uncultured Erythrobacter sp. TaxID=263913 RepID=UPI002657E489|nr:VacJ family lipoprotein [uncultured Erythrobacter sp.]
MPSLTLLATSPQLLSTALALAAPQPQAPPPPPPQVVPLEWNLAAVQDSAPPPTEGAPDDAAPPPPESEPADGELANEIVVEGEYGPPKSDPLERVNEESYRLTQAVDQTLVEPMANAYRDGLPEPIRDGLGNVVRNLAEPTNALNFLLQGKVGKAFETLGRLAINSTIGVGGLFDVAGKKADLPYRRNGFGNTMGYYGIGPGPYMFVPVTGPTSVRDIIGLTLDQALLPFAFGKPFNKPTYTVPYFVVNSLDQRLEFDAEIAAIRNSDDPYLMRRETYLAKRRRDIALLKGEPISELDQMRLEELEGTPSADTPAAAPQSENVAPVEAPANPEAIAITQPR